MAKRIQRRRKLVPKTKRFVPPPAVRGMMEALKGEKLGVDPKSLNRYMRVLPAKLAKMVTAAKKRARVAEWRNAITRYRSRTKKIPVNKLIVIDLQGVKVKSFAKGGVLLSKKVYMFKVSPKGRVKVFNKIDADTIYKKRRGQFAPQALRFFNSRTISKYNTIYREYQKRLAQDMQARGVMLSGAELNGITMQLNGDLTPFYDRVTKILSRVALSEKAPLALFVEGTLSIKSSDSGEFDRELEFQSPYITTQEFAKIVPRGKNKITHDPSALVRSRVHSAVAQVLQDNGLVSISSVRRIRRLSMNKGKPRSQWMVDLYGKKMKWSGVGMEDAVISEVTFKVVPAMRGKK